MSMLLLLLVLNTASGATPGFRQVVADLQREWLVYHNGSWAPYEAGTATTSVYVPLTNARYAGSKVEVFSPRSFSVWINGKLIRQGRNDTLRFDIDSLHRRYSAPLTLGVYSERGIERATTHVVSYRTQSPVEEELLRRNTGFRNFSVLAVLILAAFFVMMIQFNSRVTMDYFNLPRLFTLQERDETPVTGRITSRFSFLVYIFIAMWCALVLLIIFQNTKATWMIINDFLIQSTGDGFVKWGKLSLILLLIFFAKAIITFIVSAVYHFREAAALQVLNFFRLLSFVLTVVSIALLLYFIFGTTGTGWYRGLITLSAWLFGLWAVIVFLKLMSKGAFSVFHLFSYLCASEFFPIIIVFQVLFF